MEASYYLCDICGDKVAKSSRVHVETRAGVDQSGDVDVDQEILDLCPPHLADALRFALLNLEHRHKSDYARGRELMKHVERQRAKGPRSG